MINYKHRDENAKELNILLERMLENLEEFSNGIDEALLDLNTDDMNRNRRDPFDLFNNLEDSCRYFELNTQREVINPIIEDLKGIVYCGSEFVPLLERKQQAPSVKQRDYPLFVMQNIVPLMKKGITTQEECGRELNRDPTGLSKMVSRGLNISWKELLNKVEKGEL